MSALIASREEAQLATGGGDHSHGGRGHDAEGVTHRAAQEELPGALKPAWARTATPGERNGGDSLVAEQL